MAIIWTGVVPPATAVSTVKCASMNLSVPMQFPRAPGCGPLVCYPVIQLPVVSASAGSLGCQRLACNDFNGRKVNKLRIKAIPELMEHKDAAQLRIGEACGVQMAPPRKVAVAARPPEANTFGGHSQTFLNINTEDELFLGIWKEVEAKRLPAKAAAVMEEVYQNYKNAVVQSGVPNARDIVLSNMTTAFDRIFLQFEDPFTFPLYHKGIRKPFDYYTFGQNYIRPLIDFRNSYVGNLPLFDEMEKQIQQGHNVVLISNHQSEADPAVIALMLETTNSYIAERIESLVCILKKAFR